MLDRAGSERRRDGGRGEAPFVTFLGRSFFLGCVGLVLCCFCGPKAAKGILGMVRVRVESV